MWKDLDSGDASEKQSIESGGRESISFAERRVSRGARVSQLLRRRRKGRAPAKISSQHWRQD